MVAGKARANQEVPSPQICAAKQLVATTTIEARTRKACDQMARWRSAAEKTTNATHATVNATVLAMSWPKPLT
jgi:hypothetical protein